MIIIILDKSWLFYNNLKNINYYNYLFGLELIIYFLKNFKYYNNKTYILKIFYYF